MKETDLNYLVSVYKTQLEIGDIQFAYTELVKYVAKLQNRFSKHSFRGYSFGNIFQGYMDYTYFYVSSDYLKNRKLKFGLVLNHNEMRFEIWLLGQTKDIQNKYWNLLKATKWINSSEIPQYSVFEFPIIETPNFNNLDLLSDNIESQFIQISDEILESLKSLDIER